MARRHAQLSEDLHKLDGQLKRLVAETVPALIAIRGVGIDTAATFLVAVGEDPKRLRSEAAFAHVYGVAPIPDSLCKGSRYRLNR